MNEKQFQALIIQFAKLRGWLVYHVPDSRLCTSAGYPDLHLVRGDKSLFREIKTDKGRLTPAQKVWGHALMQAGADYSIWRPSDKKSIWESLM